MHILAQAWAFTVDSNGKTFGKDEYLLTPCAFMSIKPVSESTTRIRRMVACLATHGLVASRNGVDSRTFHRDKGSATIQYRFYANLAKLDEEARNQETEAVPKSSNGGFGTFATGR